MPTDYVSDFEELTGAKRVTVTKVISAPVEVPVEPTTVAEVK